MNEENSFIELYEKSLSKPKFDNVITGTVIDISRKGEIFVDFGYKADGIIPLSEYSYNQNDNPSDFLKSGDKISANLLKWNDGLGNVLLSYKRFKKKQDIEKEKEIRSKQLEEIKQQKIERNKNIELFWNNINVGKSYIGIITKIKDYGLIINLGISNALLHISEIFWDKNQKLEENFKVGDEIHVVIKDFNREEGKINLQYPLKGENPWFKLIEKYKINDIVNCKIVKFAPFGAFAEIEKGLEGLIHNSQITNLKRITKPEDFLKLEQIVNAKITNIDIPNCKIGLSIKELEGTSSEYGYNEYIKGDKIENEQ